MRSISQKLAVAAALFTTAAVAVNPVVVKGQEFIDSKTNTRFMMVGVDYQPGGQSGYMPQQGKDPLTDKDICLRDAIMLQKLGANTIRVYNVDPSLNHDDCASIFNAAGIYMVIDVNGPGSGESINRAEPWTSYHKSYLSRVFGVVENFMNYPNTLAFFSANEVMNDLTTGKVNPQYIRAVQRDLKNYIKAHSNRTIPVGYSAADVREILQDTHSYMQCDNGDASASDFFGLNSYSWCGGQATFESAGYNTIVDMFSNSSIPVFFSEYGCNEVKPRVFDEVAALYGDQMRSLSGGLVFEYSQEENEFGLATINSNKTVTLLTDYDNLQKQYNKLDLAKIQSADPSQTSVTAPKCDAKLITNSAFDTNFTIPTCPDCGDLIQTGISNPTKGKIVTVSNTQSPSAVYGSSGGEVQNLQLRVLANDQSNAPNGQVISNPSSGNSSSSAPFPFTNSTTTSSRPSPTQSSSSSSSASNPSTNNTSPQVSSPASGNTGNSAASGSASAAPQSTTSPEAAKGAAATSQIAGGSVLIAGLAWGLMML